jgi:hypothetical protein
MTQDELLIKNTRWDDQHNYPTTLRERKQLMKDIKDLDLNNPINMKRYCDDLKDKIETERSRNNYMNL